MFSLFQSCRNQLFCILVGLLVVHCVALAEDPNTPQQVLDLQKVASTCLKSKDTAGAIENYQSIIQAYPGTKYALDAQSRIITARINNSDLSAAETELASMLSTYAGLTDDIDDALDNVILAYKRNRNYQKMIEYCQYMLSHWPDCSRAIWGVSRQAQAQIMLGNQTEAERLIGVLKSNYSQEEHFGLVVCRDIGNAYINMGHPDKALQLWKDISTEFPAEPVSYMTLASYYLKRGETASASSQIDKIFTLVNAENGLIEVLQKFGYNNARGAKQYDLEQSIYDRLLQRFPDHARAPKILLCKAACCLTKGEVSSASSTVDELFAKHSGSPDFVKDLQKFGYNNARGAKQYDLEQSIYDRLLQRFPGHERVPKILLCKAVSYLTQGDTSAASATVDELFAKHAQTTDFFLPTVNTLAYLYGRQNDSGKVIELCNRALKIYPEHEKSVPIYTKLVNAYLDLNAKAQADTVTEQVLQKYSGHPDFAEIINGIADKYCKFKHSSKAIELYQLALEKAEKEGERLSAHTGIAMASAWLGDNVTAQAKLDLILANYKTHPGVGYSIFVIGEEYYNLAKKEEGQRDNDAAKYCYQKAISIWNMNITDIDSARQECLAYHYSALAYQAIENYPKAIECFGALLTEFPDYYTSKEVLLRHVKCYNDLYKQGNLSLDTAEGLEAVIEKVALAGNGSCVSELCWALGESGFKAKQWTKAAKYLGYCLRDSQWQKKHHEAAFLLGKAQEALGDESSALSSYLKYVDSSQPDDAERFTEAQSRIMMLSRSHNKGS